MLAQCQEEITQITENISKLIPIHALLIYQILWNLGNASLFRKNSISRSKIHTNKFLIHFYAEVSRINIGVCCNFSTAILITLTEEYQIPTGS